MSSALKYFSLILLALVSFNIQAQTITKPSPEFSADMLSALNPSKDLNIPTDIRSNIESENKRYVEDIMNIASGDDDDETKISKLTDLKKQRDGFIENAFKDDDLLKSYKKKINKEIKPFKRKYKLAKWVL